jgi:hypothetical protein
MSVRSQNVADSYYFGRFTASFEFFFKFGISQARPVSVIRCKGEKVPTLLCPLEIAGLGYGTSKRY